MHRSAFAALLSIGSVSAQAPVPVPPDLKFEVATLKPSPPLQPGNRGFSGIRPAPGGERYLANQCTVKSMLTVAYHVKVDQIVGGPGWLETELFDMNAKAEKPSSIDELHVMLVNLLGERFKLKLHHETKELPVYALSVDQGGPKLPPPNAGGEGAGQTWIDQQSTTFPQTKWHATSTTMDYFVFRLSQIMDRPVIDLTKLPGNYDFDLSFTRDLPPGMPENALVNGAPIDTSGPTIYEAVRKQLGLRLDRQKGQVDIIVIDHVEKLSGN